MSQLEIKTLTLGDLDTNCYLLINKQTDETTIIDPADSGDLISEEIIRNNLNLTKIILTHGHFDHVLGLFELKLNFPQASIGLHDKDLFLLKDAQNSAKYWLKREVHPVPHPDYSIEIDKPIQISGIPFEIIHTPGHTPGSLSFYSEHEKLLISGDTLFKQAIGRTDFKYSNHKHILNSLTKLLELPDETRVIAGHGSETTIGSERIWLDSLTQ